MFYFVAASHSFADVLTPSSVSLELAWAGFKRRLVLSLAAMDHPELAQMNFEQIVIDTITEFAGGAAADPRIFDGVSYAEHVRHIMLKVFLGQVV